jgi:NitT/TauT family transport system ATP-binding protein
MAANGSVIEISSLSKHYQTRAGEDVIALDNVDLNIADGEFISVVGPSGCGKTTLLKIVAGLLSRTQGDVKLRGTSVDGPRKDIGIVFQHAVLMPWRTVLENVMLPVEVQKLNKGEFKTRAEELLKLVGLSGFEDKYPFELSGGMQQRNSIVRALVTDPALLLMDEPFGALDAMTREQMNVELLRIWDESKKTVVFITHSIPEAVFLADRVVVMTPRPGKIAAIYDVNLPRPRTLDLMGDPEFGSMVTEIRHHFDAEGSID